MHAMLALAGSHLAIQVDNPQTTLALSHRQKAITGLEEAFTQWPPSAENAHIMLATTYLLSFQASYLRDGFVDSILSLRGCALLSQLVRNNNLKGIFPITPHMLSPTKHSISTDFPRYDQELACEPLRSLAKLSHLLARPSAHDIERALVAQSVETMRSLLEPDNVVVSETAATPVTTDTNTDATTFVEGEAYWTIHGKAKFTNPLFPADITLPFDDIDWDNITAPPSTRPDLVRSFNALMSTVLILTTWPYDAVEHVLSPTNQLSNVVMAHFCAMRAIVSPLSDPRAAFRAPVDAVVAWDSQFIAAVKDDEDVKWTEYVEWPKKIVRCLQACLAEKKGLTFRDLRNIVVDDPGAFKEGRASQSRGYDN